MSLQRDSTEQVFRRSLATTASSIFSVHQLSGSCGWSSLSRGLLEGHSFLCRKYPPNFPGIWVGTGHYFFKKQKMFQAHWQDSRSFLPGRMKKKPSIVFWYSQNDFQAGSGVWAEGREVPWSWEMKSLSSIPKAGPHLTHIIWDS